MADLTTWMPIYWGDYLRDTAHLSTAEHGAYLLLIAHYWVTRQPLPASDERLRRITRMEKRDWHAARATLLAFFSLDGDVLRHKRLDGEIAKATDKHERRQKAGKQGGIAKAMLWQTPKQSPPQSQPQPHESSNEDSPPVDPPTVKSDARGSRLPTDWQPDEHCSAFAAGLGLDAGRIAEDFRDYWHAKAGAAARKVDWPATWRKWCRRAADDLRKPAGAGSRGGIGSDLAEAGMLAAGRLRERRESNNLGLQSGARTHGTTPTETGAASGPDNRVSVALVHR